MRPVSPSYGNILPRGFYNRETVLVARELLGKILRVRRNGLWTSGIIVEDEAYLRDDPACHAYKGQNRKNRSMFQEPGTVYVYRIHQVHCVNAVTRTGEAVLIRALQPLENVRLPTNGPGKLCRAFHITRPTHDGKQFTGSEIQILESNSPTLEIDNTPRIGVTRARDWPLRFLIKGNPFASRPARDELRKGKSM